MRKPVFLFLLLLLLLIPSLRKRSLPLHVLQGETMGTTWEMKLVGPLPPEQSQQGLQVLAEELLLQCNQEMSTYLPDSQIRRFNAAAPGTLIPIGGLFRDVLLQALSVGEQSGGAFDPTLDPVINLWGFGHREASQGKPAAERLQEALSQCGMEHLQLTDEGLRKGVEGLQLNLSAIAKGAGVDALHRRMAALGFQGVYTEIGGEVRCSGVNPKGKVWRIGIQLPVITSQDAGSAIEVVEVADRAVATSGDYRNFREVDGEWIAHILDPRSGKPVGHRVASVSVMAKDCAIADAVATALYVMGEEEGLAWVKQRPELEAMFVLREGDGFRTVRSPGFPAAR